MTDTRRQPPLLLSAECPSDQIGGTGNLASRTWHGVFDDEKTSPFQQMGWNLPQSELSSKWQQMVVGIILMHCAYVRWYHTCTENASYGRRDHSDAMRVWSSGSYVLRNCLVIDSLTIDGYRSPFSALCTWGSVINYVTLTTSLIAMLKTYAVPRPLGFLDFISFCDSIPSKPGGLAQGRSIE